MERKTRTQQKDTGQKPAGFQNRRFRAQVGRTTAGSPVLVLERIALSRGRVDEHRQMAAFIYELAADMERRSEELGARWAVSPDPNNACVVLELTSERESPAADDFIATLMADYNLA